MINISFFLLSKRTVRNIIPKFSHRLWLPVGEGGKEGIVRDFGMDMYTLLYLKWKTNKVLL